MRAREVLLEDRFHHRRLQQTGGDLPVWGRPREVGRTREIRAAFTVTVRADARIGQNQQRIELTARVGARSIQRDRRRSGANRRLEIEAIGCHQRLGFVKFRTPVIVLRRHLA